MKQLLYILFTCSYLLVYGQYTRQIEPKDLQKTLANNGVQYSKEFTYLAFCESALVNTNLFGMMHPCCRATYSIGKQGGVAKFSCIEDSIKDFLIWYNLALPDAEELFINYLKRRGYNPNPQYYKHLELIIAINKFNL